MSVYNLSERIPRCLAQHYPYPDKSMCLHNGCQRSYSSLGFVTLYVWVKRTIQLTSDHTPSMPLVFFSVPSFWKKSSMVYINQLLSILTL